MMAVPMVDPVRQFEDSHAGLNKLVLEVSEIAQAASGDAPVSPETRARFGGSLKRLRDELLRHFADEEEGLFPFVQRHRVTQSDLVDRLAAAHDVICGAIVRLAHVVDDDRRALEPGVVGGLFERFETAYVEHSRMESALFEELHASLGEGEREELAAILRGL